MWASIKKLSTPPNSKTSLEIVRKDGSIFRDLEEVLTCWLQDISGLYSGIQQNPDIVFDDTFYSEILQKKREFEETLLPPQNADSDWDVGGIKFSNYLR